MASMMSLMVPDSARPAGGGSFLAHEPVVTRRAAAATCLDPMGIHPPDGPLSIRVQERLRTRAGGLPRNVLTWRPENALAACLPPTQTGGRSRPEGSDTTSAPEQA